MRIEDTVVDLCRAARQAARPLAMAPTSAEEQRAALAASRLRERAAELLDANRADVAAGRRDGTDATLCSTG